MLRLLGKTTASEARNGGSSSAEVCVGGDEGLSTWELVSAFQSEDEDLYSYDSVSDVSTGDDLEPLPSEDEEEDVDADVNALAPRDSVSPNDIIAIQAMSVSPPMDFPVVMAINYVARDFAQDCSDYGDVNQNGMGDGGDDEEEGVDYDHDVDDELVPWKLKGRFGKQRITKMGIRKMGQRGGPKLKGKKLPYYDNRPGLSYGKLR